MRSPARASRHSGLTFSTQPDDTSQDGPQQGVDQRDREQVGRNLLLRFARNLHRSRLFGQRGQRANERAEKGTPHPMRRWIRRWASARALIEEKIKPERGSVALGDE
jgi:hypothetical protein